MKHLCNSRRRQAKKLAFLGKERSLISRTLLYTGLRKSELASVTLGQVYLDERTPYLELLAKDEKAGRGAMIPLRADLVEHLRSHIHLPHKKHHTLQLTHNTPLFKITQDMMRVFGRDLTAASIAKYDQRAVSSIFTPFAIQLAPTSLKHHAPPCPRCVTVVLNLR
ncbi:Phage integrase family protein [Poriferisphaera corsica]|uniref:Phage integrase family protein n=1 Tax=Poriferisphaera corsica TaxID=2528020 RepID=A0A517YS64_9BACT|nr:tyrosine-type recombinase/integrase [Poriferisphaera corsica]QDU33069.1 Phage integrase family protein [Poriferisphaera corsica]